ncbi:conserved hypothetical protein [Culex quinquefasciatus]|uniref:Uncharacterized protein n=1 Tax=Culex quinquefasciatus TaxID=7176 RepID=B0XHW1_CULQU|nr:conserved hypothetical protein [Culex quinquefasciatus]|eukprot:XP_001869233.1 conserved hypothetical protein [Culex quinquefasciatus]
MAMVVSGRAKAVIGAFICFFLLGIVLVTGSTKGWFVPVRYNHERVAARIQIHVGKIALKCSRQVTSTVVITELMEMEQRANIGAGWQYGAKGDPDETNLGEAGGGQNLGKKDKNDRKAASPSVVFARFAW